MPVFRREQNQVHSMEGNHIAGVATPTSGAQQVEMCHGWMDANSATPAAQPRHRGSGPFPNWRRPGDGGRSRGQLPTR